jgi:hypothetical protein
MFNRLFFTFLVFFVFNSMYAQSGPGWGIKGGLNYGSSGDVINSIETSVQNPDNNLGWHLGIYGKIGNQIYFRPELTYTRLNSDYDGNKFKLQKLDVPLLVGLKVIGPLHVFAGPSFQYILNTDLENFKLSDVENDFSVGINFGAGLNLGRLGIDLRYERGFSDNETAIIEGISESIVGRLDTRPAQLILSLSYNLN